MCQKCMYCKNKTIFSLLNRRGLFDAWVKDGKQWTNKTLYIVIACQDNKKNDLKSFSLKNFAALDMTLLKQL